METLRLLTIHSLFAHWVRSRDRPLPCVVSLHPVRRTKPEAGCLRFGTTLKPNCPRAADVRPLKFLGDPNAGTPCSSTPAGSITPGQLRRLDTVPTGGNYGDSCNKQGFRSSIAWLATLAVYASQPPSPTTTQDSLPAVGQTLPGGILTHRAPLKGLCNASYITLLLSQVKLDTMPLFACRTVLWRVPLDRGNGFGLGT